MVRYLFLAAVIGAAAVPAQAQDRDDGGVDIGPVATVSASATAATDYRFRGISRSDGDPVLQGQAFVELGGGLYAGVWGSTLGSDGAGDAELDLIAGYDMPIASGTSLDIGLTYYAFLGDGGVPLAQGLGDLGSYAEPYAKLSYTLGPVRARLGASYAPSQDSIGGDNLYLSVEADAGIPLTPWTIKAKVGRSDGALVPGTRPAIDWSVGADYVIGPVTLGARYVDTDIPQSGIAALDRLYDPTVTLSATIGF